MLLALVTALSSAACMSRRGYLDWQPGLTAGDFQGVFRLSLRHYERVASEAFADHSFDEHAAVEWQASSPDRRYAALIHGPTLAATIDSGSTRIDVGSLIDGFGGYRVLTLGRADTLIVLALPEKDGVVAILEPSYMFSFRYQPDAREAWAVSVARVLLDVDVLSVRK
jgi:hypothetical protein